MAIDQLPLKGNLNIWNRQLIIWNTSSSYLDQTSLIMRNVLLMNRSLI